MPLTLDRASAPLREPAAWFLPEPEPAAWLAEIARWPVATETVVFYPIAKDARSSEAAGVLIVPPAGTRVPPGGRAQPFGTLAPGIFLPIDARLLPAVAADELKAATRFAVLVFHPSLGLTGADESEGRRAWDLIAPPERATEDWSRARAGAPRPPGLRAVHLRAELTLAEIFGEESKDIASESPADLPPAPGERRDSPLDRALGRGSEAIAKAVLGLAGWVPRTPGAAPNWINQLENWAAQKLSGFTADLERERHRELHRLLELMRRDVEEGLRRAIPLAGLAHRGQAAPGAQLGRRTLDFNLGRLGGGRAADFWDVPEQIRSSLAQQYREAAMREQKLGRHRRAACIFAELLGDFAAAADALKQGRFFREAARLYQEHLRNPLAAAECLAAAGLFAEAIAIYEQEKRWIELAEVHARLGDTAAEHAAVRKAVAAKAAAGAVVDAARLLDRRLDAPDEALALLAATWPTGAQAIACLGERFDVLQRRQRTEAVRDLIAQLAREAPPRSLLTGVADLLAKTAENTADARVRRAAADAVRVRVAGGLADGALRGSGETTLLRALTRVAPGDRLLTRDVLRFRTSRPQPQRAARAVPPASAAVPRVECEKTGGSQLPPGVKWTRACGDAAGFHAAGYVPDGNVFYWRANWSGHAERITWADPAPDRRGLFFLLPHLSSTLIGRPFAPRLSMQPLQAVDAFGGRIGEAGTPPWLPDDTVQIANSRFSVWAARVVGERVVLEGFEGEKRVTSRDVTEQLVAAGATGAGTSLLLAAQLGLGQVALGYGRHVLVQAGTNPRIQDLGARVLGLEIGLPGAPGWIALLEKGAAFVAPDGASHYVIDEQLVMPRAARLGGDLLLLIGENEGSVVKITAAGAKRVAWFPFVSGNGIALTPAAQPREFAVLHESGLVQRWRLPA